MISVLFGKQSNGAALPSIGPTYTQQDIHDIIPVLEDYLTALDACREATNAQVHAFKVLGRATSKYASTITARSIYSTSAIQQSQVQVMSLVCAANTFSEYAVVASEFSKALNRQYDFANRHVDKYFEDLAAAEAKLESNLLKAQGAVAARRRDTSKTKEDSAESGPITGYRLGHSTSPQVIRANHFIRFTRKLSTTDQIIASCAADLAVAMFTGVCRTVEKCNDQACIAGLDQWKPYLDNIKHIAAAQPNEGSDISPESSTDERPIQKKDKHMSARFRPSTWRISLNAHLDEVLSTAKAEAETTDAERLIGEVARLRTIKEDQRVKDEQATISKSPPESESIHSFSVQQSQLKRQNSKARNPLASILGSFRSQKRSRGTRAETGKDAPGHPTSSSTAEQIKENVDPAA